MFFLGHRYNGEFPQMIFGLLVRKDTEIPHSTKFEPGSSKTNSQSWRPSIRCGNWSVVTSTEWAIQDKFLVQVFEFQYDPPLL